MTKQEIQQIRILSKSLTAREIGERFGYHENTIRYWAKRLRESGVTVTFKKLPAGRKAINLE